jgi:hypothetical protein
MRRRLTHGAGGRSPRPGLALIGFLLLALTFPGAATAARWIQPYDFPITDPVAATVVGTPPYLRAELPALVRSRNFYTDSIRVFPDRAIPPVLWYNQDGLEYGVVYQDHPAPLVVLIAGTGATFNSSTMRLLAAALYGAGFHVLGLPSPSFPNFIVTASATSVPGRMDDDAQDIYRALELILPRVRQRVPVTDLYLTGYSLGAMNAAFVARQDARERRLGFERVLLLNPPVSLFASIGILDAMFDNSLGADRANAQRFVEQAFQAFASLHSSGQEVDLTGDFVYQAYRRLRPTDIQLRTLIGLSFRLASNNLAFTSDVMTRSGYIVAPTAELTPSTSLTRYFVVGQQRSFEDYVEGLYLPFFRKHEPGLTLEGAIRDASLKPLEAFIRSDKQMGLITNADDIILAKGDLDYLTGIFGDRAVIFPHGGHLGNFGERRFLEELVGFFGGHLAGGPS